MPEPHKSEIAALDRAITGFCAFVRSKIPPSQERDETLEDVERLREGLARMLPGHSQS